MKNNLVKSNLTTKKRIQLIRQGNIRIAAQTCSMIENEDPESEKLLQSLYPYSGKAIVVGITGPPGAGKSTVLSCLIEEAIAQGYPVGVIAIDPSSPITGGALLADRLRFSSKVDDRLFTRSVASRGLYGGLSYAAYGILRVLEAMGKKIIFIETVGSGQSEIAVTHLATTTLYVTIPNLGDDIQALKAGILEVSDIFLINKSDLGQSALAESQLKSSLSLVEPNAGKSKKVHWTPPIHQASALKKKGIHQVFKSILQHQKYLKSSGEIVDRKKKQVSNELRVLLDKIMNREIHSQWSGKWLASLIKHKKDPYSLSKKIIKSVLNR